MKIMNKKGQVIDQLSGLVIALVAIAIVLVVGFLIMAQAKVQVVADGKSTTYVNETVTGWTTGTVFALTYSGGCMKTSISCGNVYNGTTHGEALTNTSKYSCAQEGITVNNLSTDGFATRLNVTYTCANMTAAYNATEATQNATADIPGWLPIIIITLIGAALIGLVSMFRRR